MELSYIKILLITQLCWLFFKEELLFNNWWFIPLILLSLIIGAIGEGIGKKLKEKIK